MVKNQVAEDVEEGVVVLIEDAAEEEVEAEEAAEEEEEMVGTLEILLIRTIEAFMKKENEDMRAPKPMEELLISILELVGKEKTKAASTDTRKEVKKIF